MWYSKRNRKRSSNKTLKGEMEGSSSIPLDTIIIKAVNNGEFEKMLEDLPDVIFDKLKKIIDKSTKWRHEDVYEDNFEEDETTNNNFYFEKDGDYDCEEEDDITRLIQILEANTIKTPKSDVI